MGLYSSIVGNFGNSLSDYVPGSWDLFMARMTGDISGQYMLSSQDFFSGSLLEYSKDSIKKSEKKVGQNDKFTYYKNKEKFVLANPYSQFEDDDFKPDSVGPNTITKLSPTGLGHENAEYSENNVSVSIGQDETLGKSSYKTINLEESNPSYLVSKTQQLFIKAKNEEIKNKFDVLVSRFHTNQITEDSVALQAGTSKYGLSKGRNLLKKDGQTTNYNGYDDPYCRVWTWHKQYHRIVEDTMRPFKEAISGDTLETNNLWSVFRSSGDEDKGKKDGGTRLREYGVMYSDKGTTNGLVNITPSYSNGEIAVSPKKCMFSIENLAWKDTFNDWSTDDVNGLSKEQKGPLGGRIMWFPPYDLKFNESTQANWQTTEFIGRGEPIYTYTNTVRSGTLSFKLLIDHPAILDYWERRDEIGDIGKSGPDETQSKEQEMLRFFAGCEVLKAKPQEKVKKEPDPNQEINNGENVEATQGSGKKIQFFVFFPNNYSGKDDRGSSVNPIEYLINGVGCNKYYTGTEDDICAYSTETTDLQTDVSKTYVYNEYLIGGYEMGYGKGVSIVNENTNTNEIATIKTYGTENEYKLIKMICNGADKACSGTSTTWNDLRYYYRVDDDTLDQNLSSISYIDTDSSKLNFYKTTEFTNNVLDRFGIENSDNVYAFAEVFLALSKVNGSATPSFEDLYSTRENILKLVNIFQNNTIKRVYCQGWASSQGNNKSKNKNKTRNQILAEERAKTVMWWLYNSIKNKDGQEILHTDIDFAVDDDTTYDRNDANNIKAKATRCVFVEIEYDDEKKENFWETSAFTDLMATINDKISGDKGQKADIEENVKEIKYKRERLTTINRYDREGLFFERLKDDAPFMAKLLSERIKNFDPVFHSMSPEGFNSRLTFLEQCMRQGPTVGATDTSGKNTNNLAFGRPPVCVLRIGDFYNTKIVITSIQKDYDPFVWDLNQEGIGVMPMIANITIGFNFIGGSDLAGPIQRLQNATSFNYYANTGVYDNRAEEIEYDETGKESFYAFLPEIKNIPDV